MLIGIDGGGTKTDICLAHTDGTVLSRRITGGSNPAALGVERANNILAEAIRGVASDAPVTALYAGIAGASNAAVADSLTKSLRAAFPHIPSITITSDALNALTSEIGIKDGIAMISGTGSSAFVRKYGQVHQVGGWGYLIDDAGSGFALGRACLKAAFRALDGRGAPTILLDLIEEQLALPLKDALPGIYAGGSSYIASFAKTALHAAFRNDPIAIKLVDTCAGDIADHIRVCQSILAKPAPIVLSGGMFQSELLYEKVLTRVKPLSPIRSTLPPVFGALVSAADLAGIPVGAAFRQNFLQSLPDKERI